MNARSRGIDQLCVIVPFLLFMGHALLFRSWIIDDAGISFVYARNLAHGYGLVAQPGDLPVEGFSNFTWVMILATYFRLGGTDPVIFAKVASIVLVFVTFEVISRVMQLLLPQYRIGTVFVLSMLSLNTSFVVWSVSGLENPLTVLLVVLLMRCCIQPSRNARRQEIQAALLATLLALTRPDGAAYVLVFPFLAVTRSTVEKTVPKLALQRAMTYSAIVMTAIGSFAAFRYAYFGDVLPNTYYAKVGAAGFAPAQVMPAILTLLQGCAIPPALAAGIIALLIYVGLHGFLDFQRFAVVSVLALTGLIYALLPPDWMPEFRFATPFFPLLYILLFVIGRLTIAARQSSRLISALVWTGSLLFAAASAQSFAVRSTSFARAPTVPFQVVGDRYGRAFSDRAARLGIKHASILLPDIGGTLYYSSLKVFDLAGLTDRTIARSIGQRQQTFYNYIFEVAKPTFIHAHAWWTYAANLDGDPRFREDYVPMAEYVDLSVWEQTGLAMYSGDYVRKDALNRANLGEFILMRATMNSPK